MNGKADPAKEVLVMENRDRAWRRKKTRHIVSRIKDTKNWLLRQFENPEAKDLPREERKRHKPGKLTRAQVLRQHWSLSQEMGEGF